MCIRDRSGIVGGGSGGDDTGGLARNGPHEAGEAIGHDGSSSHGTAIPQDAGGEGLGDARGETPGGTDTIHGTDAIGRGSPSGGDVGGMGGTRRGADTGGRPPGGGSPLSGGNSEDR